MTVSLLLLAAWVAVLTMALSLGSAASRGDTNWEAALEADAPEYAASLPQQRPGDHDRLDEPYDFLADLDVQLWDDEMRNR